MALHAQLRVALSLIKADGGLILRIHVKPDLYGASVERGVFKVAQKCLANAFATMLGKHLDGLDVGSDLIMQGRPLHDREANQGGIFLGHPGCCVAHVQEFAKVGAREPNGRLKAQLLDGVELIEVLGAEQAKVHSAIVWDRATKKPSEERMASVAREKKF